MPTDEDWARARAVCEDLGLVHIGVVGEREDGQCRPVSVNMVSVNHFSVVVDLASLHFGDYDPAK